MRSTFWKIAGKKVEIEEGSFGFEWRELPNGERHGLFDTEQDALDNINLYLRPNVKLQRFDWNRSQ